MIFFETLLAFVFINNYIMQVMSRCKKIKWIITVFVVAVALVLPVVAQEETDEILHHYQKRAGEVFDGRNPFISGVTFSFEATTFRKIYDKNGNTSIADSSISLYYYSFGNLDSIVTKVPSEKKIDSTDMQYPNIFKGIYKYNFYPNDTGGKELSIGYDSYEFDPSVPIGIATIDRDRYFLKQLYMHFVNEKRIDRSSKAFRFIEFEGYIFPDSVWELKCKSGIFTREYYRIETGIRNIKIQR